LRVHAGRRGRVGDDRRGRADQPGLAGRGRVDGPDRRRGLPGRRVPAPHVRPGEQADPHVSPPRTRAAGCRSRRIYAGITLSEPYPSGLPEVARRRALCIADGRLAALEATPAGSLPARGVCVLLPGFTGSKEDFIPLLPPIAAAGYRVISYDQRGQYESIGPARERAYSIALFERDLRQVIGVVSNGEPVHLVGHSFGGLVARNVVIAEPALVRSLTLLDSGPAGASLLRARSPRPLAPP